MGNDGSHLADSKRISEFLKKEGEDREMKREGEREAKSIP